MRSGPPAPTTVSLAPAWESAGMNELSCVPDSAVKILLDLLSMSSGN